MQKELKPRFKQHFNREDGIIFFSPGRVNLIGEHVDYNGGFVLPCAISYGTYAITNIRNDRFVHVYSEGFSEKVISFSIDHIEKDSENWVNFIKGSILALQDYGCVIDKGIDLYITSDLPIGAGLSSSASIEMLIMEIFNQLFNLKLTLLTLAQLGRHVENHFIGVNSGIMDQFAVIAGKKDHALMLQTQTLSYRYAPMFFENETLLIINTNKKRTLSDSKYNERYQECQEALSLIKSHYDKPIEYLCDLSLKEFEKVAPFLSPLLFKRVRHLVTENDRTVASHDALKSGDIYGFARYLNASHQSLKNDYEVTGIELDTLQDLLIKAGAIGARMTGAGFGGCVVALVPKKMKTKIKNEVTKKYKEIIGYEPTFYVVKPSDGTKKVA